jgi:hypothetical protein
VKTLAKWGRRGFLGWGDVSELELPLRAGFLADHEPRIQAALEFWTTRMMVVSNGCRKTAPSTAHSLARNRSGTVTIRAGRSWGVAGVSFATWAMVRASHGNKRPANSGIPGILFRLAAISTGEATRTPDLRIMRPQGDKLNCCKGNDLRQDVETVSHYLPTDACQTDTDLAVVVASWSELPAAVRAGIVAMVKAAVETWRPA